MIAIRLRGAVLALGCLAFASGTAQAAERASVKTSHYSISGSTGLKLYLAMVKRGPRHGFTSRAIAQTAYTVKWDAEVRAVDGICRVVSATPKLAITYTYPKPEGRMSPALRRSWSRFMAGVRTHEERHGRLAREMVSAAVKSIRGVKTSNDPSCRKTRTEISRRTHAIYAAYEARQEKFDEVEHRDGGNIDRLILGLVKAK